MLLQTEAVINMIKKYIDKSPAKDADSGLSIKVAQGTILVLFYIVFNTLITYDVL